MSNIVLAGVKEVPAPPRIDSDHFNFSSFLKIVFLGLFGIIFFILAVYFLNQFFINANINNLILVLCFLAIFVVFTILDVFFIKNLGVLLVFSLLKSIAPLIIFHKYIGADKVSFWTLVGGGFGCFLFIFLGFIRGRSILLNSIKLNFFIITKFIAPKILTGVLLFATVIFYLSFFEWSSFNREIGKKLTEEILVSVEPAVKIWFPGARLNQSLDELLFLIVEEQMSKINVKNLGGPEIENLELSFNLLPVEAKKTLMTDTVAQLRQKIENIIGPITSDETVKNIIFRAGNYYFNKLTVQINQYNLKFVFSIVLAFFIFVLLKSAFIPFYWFFELCAFILFNLLVATGFAYISLESTRKETVVV